MRLSARYYLGVRLQNPNHFFFHAAEAAASASHENPRSINEILANQSSTKFLIAAKDSNSAIDSISIGWDGKAALYQIKTKCDENAKPFLSVLKERKVLDVNNDETEIKQVIRLLKDRYQNFIEASGAASREELLQDEDYADCAAFMSPRLTIPLRDFMNALDFRRVQSPSVKESQPVKKIVEEESNSAAQALAKAPEQLTVDQILDSFEAKDLTFSVLPRMGGGLTFLVSSQTEKPLAINYVLHSDATYTNSFSSMGAGVSLNPEQSLKLVTKLKEGIGLDVETSSEEKEQKHSQISALLKAIKKA